MGPLENSSNKNHYRLNGSKDFLNSLLDFLNSTCFKRPLLKRPPVGFSNIMTFSVTQEWARFFHI